MSPDFQPVVPAVLSFLDNATLYSSRFDDIYASANGALEQAQHVFLDGNDLPRRWQGANRFTIVETGFGAGLNFLATWRALRQSGATGVDLHYVSVEKHPFPLAALEAIHERYSEIGEIADRLREQYPPLLPGFHRLHFDNGRVTLTLLFGDAAEMLHQLQARVDAFFLDGFAPARNPDMWSAGVFRELARLAGANATLATYTVAASVWNGLEAAGFALEKRQGFASKREMLCGRYARPVKETGNIRDKRVIVIGAGLAGTSCANSMARRGWDVLLIERHPGPAQEASGIPAGLMRPVFSLDWNPHSRFTSGAFLYAIRHRLAARPLDDEPTPAGNGVLQLARDAFHFEKQQRIVEQFSLPRDLACVVQTREATEIAGTTVAGPAIWFPSSGWASPAAMCRSNLDHSGGGVTNLYGCDVAGVRRTGACWDVLDASGQVLAHAPAIVLANALTVRRFVQADWLPLRPVRGQVSLMPQRIGRDLRTAVCREGYITPAKDGMHCVGATFNEDLPDIEARLEDHETNLLRLESMLPGFGEGVTTANLGARVAFRTMSFDRLPVLGALPDPRRPASGDTDGLFTCLALGSRGMTWAALSAEIVASRVCGEPMPIEASMLKMLEPDRFLRMYPERRNQGGKPGGTNDQTSDTGAKPG